MTETTTNTSKKIIEAITGARKKGNLTLRHLERYLYTLAFEVGCDTPNDNVIDEIAQLLVREGRKEIPYERFQEVVKVGLALYDETQKVPIGGIF